MSHNKQVLEIILLTTSNVYSSANSQYRVIAGYLQSICVLVHTIFFKHVNVIYNLIFRVLQSLRALYRQLCIYVSTILVAYSLHS